MSIEYKSGGGGASKGRLGRDVSLKPSNPTLFKTKIVHLGTLLKTLFYYLDLLHFTYVELGQVIFKLI